MLSDWANGLPARVVSTVYDVAWQVALAAVSIYLEYATDATWISPLRRTVAARETQLQIPA